MKTTEKVLASGALYRPFDLEAAKRGEKVEIRIMGAWRPVHFVGVASDGRPVVDLKGDAFKADELTLRTAPKKVTWYCLHYLDGDGVPQLKSSRDPLQDDYSVLKRLGVPFTIEVEE